MEKKESPKQFLANKVKRIMAGYKANYNKSINNARSENERKALLDARDKWISKKRGQVITSMQLELESALRYLEQSK